MIGQRNIKKNTSFTSPKLSVSPSHTKRRKGKDKGVLSTSCSSSRAFEERTEAQILYPVDSRSPSEPPRLLKTQSIKHNNYHISCCYVRVWTLVPTVRK